MKLDDAGFFFIKAKGTDWPSPKWEGNILVLVYTKTNLIKKTQPKLFKDRKLPENHVMIAMFDRGVDYVGGDPISYKDFELMLKEDFKGKGDIYDSKKYTPSALYKEIKKGGLKKVYSEKWLEEEYAKWERRIEE